MLNFNNPMNIRISNIPWSHKDNPPQNDQFETFPTPYDGLHAGMENILHAQVFHDCRTIREIISRLSPPSENDTAAYISHVCDSCGVQPDETYDLTINGNLTDISKAVIVQENGRNPYTDQLITEIANDLTKEHV